MSQPSSSIISADNAELKYKKALKEISKLIQANRVLRETNEKSEIQLKQKIDQLSLRYEDLEKDNEIYKKQKQSLAHYLDQIQKQKGNLQKEVNKLERQVGYLNDVLAQQNAELKKLNMHKDERAVAALIRTYEEKETTMNRNRNQNQQMIIKLKVTIEKLESQLEHQKNIKDENQQRYRALSLDINKYKEQNSSLHQQIERLLKESSQKDSFSIQKQKQLRLLVVQLQRQLNLLKNIQEDSSKGPSAGQTESYEQLLNEKNKIAIQLTKLQSIYEQQMMREKEYFEMEEKMKTAKLQAERANEEVNMLKSKIVVLQAKQFLEEAGDDDYDQKFFQQRLNILISQNDPLNSIKNHEDSSHFRILKSFIVDLQDKIYKISSEKKQVVRKYKSLKTKFVKTAQSLAHYQQQHKLMKGKLESFERFTQKLHFELQKTVSSHEDEITRMTITSNNIITKKVDEYKTTINFLNSQLEMNQDKASRTEKNYKQQIQTLKLELDTLKIKFRDESDKSGKDNELIQLYKKKNAEISNRITSLEEQLASSNQNLGKFQHLFKEEKGKNEGLLSQKQQLIAQNKQLTEQIDKKSSSFSNNFKIKEDQYQFQLKKVRSQNQRLKDDSDNASRQAKNLQKQLQQIRRGDQSQVGQIKRLTQRNTQLEAKLAEFKRKLRNVQDQNQTIKIKSKKFQQNYQKASRLQQQNISKNDRVNDLTRQKISLQNEIKTLQGHLSEQSKLNEELKKQLASMKMKSLESNHESKREFESKIFQNKKVLQSLNQQISDLTTELREQKSKNLRLNNELNTVKSERNRIQQLIDQNRKKDIQNEGQIGNIKLQLSNAEMEIERLQSEVRSQQNISNNLNQEVETLQQKIFTLNQEISNLKMKLQSAQDLKSELVRDLSSLKFNLIAAETFSNKAKSNINLSYDEQSFHTSLTDIISKIKRICRNYGITIQSSSTTVSYQTSSYEPINSNVRKQTTTTTFVETKSKGNGYLDYFKSYADPNVKSPEKVANPVIQNPSGGEKVQGTGSGSGSGYLQYFKSYADSHQAPRQTGTNFQQGLGTTQSIGLGKNEYNYRNDYSGSFDNQEIGGTSSYSWEKPTYNYNQAQFNFAE